MIEGTKVVILPTYNEKLNIKKMVERILALKLGISVLIVDDNSPDGTGELADELSNEHFDVNVIHRKKKEGLGKAYIEGFSYCLENKFDYIITMDADMSHDPKYLKDCLCSIKDNDVVIGSRYVQGISVVNWSIKRVLLSYYANRYVRMITGLPIKDCTSGFICFKSKVFEKLDMKNGFRTQGYSFLVEIKYRLYKEKFKLEEFPIIFVERSEGETKMDMKVVLEAFTTPIRLVLGL